MGVSMLQIQLFPAAGIGGTPLDAEIPDRRAFPPIVILAQDLALSQDLAVYSRAGDALDGRYVYLGHAVVARVTTTCSPEVPEKPPETAPESQS